MTSFDKPPRYQQFAVPEPRTADEILVDVLAVGLHPRTRTGAAGGHYTSTGTLPMIPGIDGVGRRGDGKRIYFVADDDSSARWRTRPSSTHGDRSNCPTSGRREGRGRHEPRHVSLGHVATPGPDRGGPERPGLGATGSAGTMAVQIAKRLAPVGLSAPAVI